MNTSLSSVVTKRNRGHGTGRTGGSSAVVVEAIEGRVLMSGVVTAAAPEPQALLLPAVQKIRDAAARLTIVDGTSNTIFFG